MIEYHLPILMIVIPLFSAPLCVLLSNRKLTGLLAFVVCWLTFGISVWLLAQVTSSGPIAYDLGGWKAPYGIVYVVDSLSAFFTTIVSGMAALVITYSPRSIDREIPKSKHYLFHATYLLCMTGLLGICVTGDLFNVFVFLEIASLSSYALISLGRTRRAPLAAFQYLVMGTIGATFILIGIGLLFQMTGSLNMADMAVQLEKSREIAGGDWTYRRLIPGIPGVVGPAIAAADRVLRNSGIGMLKGILNDIGKCFNDSGLLGRTWTTSAMVVWAALLLGLCLLLYYL